MASSTHTLILRSTAGHEFQFWFLVAIALAISAVFYAGAVHPRLRFSGGRDLPALPRSAAIALALIPFGLVTNCNYQSNWGVFYQVDVHPEQLGLRYFYPERTVTLAPGDVSEIKRRLSLRAHRDTSVVLLTADGDRHQSVDMDADRSAELRRIMREWHRAAHTVEPPRPR